MYGVDADFLLLLLMFTRIVTLQHSSDPQCANCRLLSEDSAAGEVLPADGWSDGQKWTAGSQLKISHLLAYF